MQSNKQTNNIQFFEVFIQQQSHVWIAETYQQVRQAFIHDTRLTVERIYRYPPNVKFYIQEPDSTYKRFRTAEGYVNDYPQLRLPHFIGSLKEFSIVREPSKLYAKRVISDGLNDFRKRETG